MKKRNAFLLAAVALLAFAACIDKDLYDPEHANEVRQAQYEKAFRQAFGEIDPNHDWGFGTSATKALTSRATRGYTFSEDDPTVYKTAVPEGIPSVDTYQASWDGSKNVPQFPAYYAPSGTQTVNMYGGGELYFPAGNYTINSWYVANANVYLLPGAHVTINVDEVNFNFANSIISIAEDASLTCEKLLKFQSQVYNRGTINAKELNLYDNGKIVSAGKIDIDGNVTLNSAANEFVNLGNFNCKGIQTASGSHFQNVGETLVDGNTVIDSNNCSWQNQGKYETNNLTFNGGSDDVLNGCRMVVHGLFKIILGNCDPFNKFAFKMDAGSSLVAQEFQLGTSTIEMGEKAMIMVKGTAHMGIANNNYGIYGPTTGDYALFTAAHIISDGVVEEKGINTTPQDPAYIATTYGGNLIVASDDNRVSNVSGQGKPYYVTKAPAQVVSQSVAADLIYIENSKCNDEAFGNKKTTPTTYTVKYLDQETGVPLQGEVKTNGNVNDVVTVTDHPASIVYEGDTYNYVTSSLTTITLVADEANNVITFYYKKNTTTTTTKTVVDSYRVFAEDLGSIGDFDFNDVVFDVIWYNDNSTDVVLQAAGGTLPLYLKIPGLKDEEGNAVDMVEVHGAFGVGPKDMVNTYSRGQVPPRTFTVQGSHINPANVGILVYYNNNEESQWIRAELGWAPGKFCLPGTNVDWPNERQQIGQKYEDFEKWVRDHNYVWWKEKLEINVKPNK